MSEDIVSIGRVVEKMFGNLSVEDTRKAVTITNEWKKIVSRIKPSPNSSVRNENIGNNLADHSRVVDLKNGVLLVEADHPGWISLLQFYKSFILRGYKMNMPDVKIHNVVFKLSGMKGDLYDTIEDRERDGKRLIEKRIEEDEKCPEPQVSEILAEKKKKELPDELKSIFADLENSMMEESKMTLTNSKK